MSDLICSECGQINDWQPNVGLVCSKCGKRMHDAPAWKVMFVQDFQELRDLTNEHKIERFLERNSDEYCPEEPTTPELYTPAMALEEHLQRHIGQIGEAVYHFAVWPAEWEGEANVPEAAYFQVDCRGQHFQISKLTSEPWKCHVCGCMEHNCKGCIERTGQACHWVALDLCSACDEPVLS